MGLLLVFFFFSELFSCGVAHDVASPAPATANAELRMKFRRLVEFVILFIISIGYLMRVKIN